MNQLTILIFAVKIRGKDMEDLVSQLDELLVLTTEEPRTLIGPLTYGLDKKEITVQIQRIKNHLPLDIVNASENAKKASQLKEIAQHEANSILEAANREAERIIEESKREAGKIVEQAEIERERLVSSSEVLKLGRARADALVTDAEAKAATIKADMNAYAKSVLGQLETSIDKVSANLKANQREFAQFETQSGVKTSERAQTERIRV
jgi:cell division septum initiation protein DivIVA